MERSDRQERIINYLKIKPISHGQVEVSLLTAYQSDQFVISEQRRAELAQSLSEQTGNLMPLIVRRTELNEDDYVYEILYGLDWFIVAKEIGIERLWVWVFEVADEEIDRFKDKINQLMSHQACEPASLIEMLTEKVKKASLSKDFDAYVEAEKKLQVLEELEISRLEREVRKLEAHLKITELQGGKPLPRIVQPQKWTVEELKREHKTLVNVRDKLGIRARSWNEAVEELNQKLTGS